MLSLQSISLTTKNKQPLLPSSFTTKNNKKKAITTESNEYINKEHKKTTRHVVVKAVKKNNESQQYEIDQDKAKQALQQLDQQLQALSMKQVTPPKIKASDVKLTRDQIMEEEEEEEVPEIEGSILVYAAVILFGFTIFYNVLFYSVIKPSIDRQGSPLVAMFLTGTENVLHHN